MPPQTPIPLPLTIQVRAELMWDSSTDRAAIRSRTTVAVNVDTPAVFKLVPTPLLEAIVSRATRAVLDTLLEVFLRNVAADYVRWASDAGYRASRTALSLTPIAAVSGSIATAPRPLYGFSRTARCRVAIIECKYNQTCKHLEPIKPYQKRRGDVWRLEYNGAVLFIKYKEIAVQRTLRTVQYPVRLITDRCMIS